MAVAVLAACGPIVYVDQVTRKASASVAAAKSAEADKYAPYYYTLSVEYLHKAREEAAHADYQAANRFGRKSHEAAVKAREVALANASDPNFEPVDTAPPNGDRDADAKAADGDGDGDAKPVDGMAPLVEDDDDATDGDGDASDDGATDGDGDDEDRR